MSNPFLKLPSKMIADHAHMGRATWYFDSMKPVFTELSELQLAYISAVTMDDRIPLHEKSMMVITAMEAGPDLAKPVDQESVKAEVADLREAVDQLFLECAKPAGRA